MKIRIPSDDGSWMQQIDVCGDCVRELGAEQDEDVPESLHWNGEDRFSAGVYAGHYCDRHWKQKGYRKDLPNIVGGMTEDEIEAFDYREG